jgi:hypothetical protein
MRQTETIKLFYKKYPYRIKFQNPSNYAYQNEIIYDSDEYNERHKDIRAAFKNVGWYLKKESVDYKTRFDIYHSYFLEDEYVFQYLCENYAQFIEEATVPYRKDITKIYKSLNTNAELRKGLYHGMYRYKMMIIYKSYAEREEATESINEVMSTLNVRDNGKWANCMGSVYSAEPLYFETYDQVCYAAMMLLHVKIKKIYEAVLINEVGQNPWVNDGDIT